MMLKKITLTLLLLVIINACSEQKQSEPATTKTSKTDTTKISKTTTTKQSETTIFKQGDHYRQLDNPIAINNDDIVVNEFFWYGCGHCERFEPFLHQWEKTKPAGVVVKRVPAVWREQMKLHGKLYFMAQTLDRSEELHTLLFKKVMPLREEKDLDIQKKKLAEVFASFGLEGDSFQKQLDSFKVNSQLDESMEMMKVAKVTGTPTLMVNGKYVVLNKRGRKPGEVMDIVDYLIELEKNNNQ